jgi:hypothetical protein
LYLHFFCLDAKETKQRKNQEESMLPPALSVFNDFPYNTPYHGNNIVRSQSYNPVTFIPSDKSNKTTLINATLSFDYSNLIQVYAGNDNIPFTKDDMFLYAPNFFNRFTVNMTIE